jgi:hypothetical protein
LDPLSLPVSRLFTSIPSAPLPFNPSSPAHRFVFDLPRLSFSTDFRNSFGLISTQFGFPNSPYFIRLSPRLSFADVTFWLDPTDVTGLRFRLKFPISSAISVEAARTDRAITESSVRVRFNRQFSVASWVGEAGYGRQLSFECMARSRTFKNWFVQSGFRIVASAVKGTFAVVGGRGSATLRYKKGTPIAGFSWGIGGGQWTEKWVLPNGKRIHRLTKNWGGVDGGWEVVEEDWQVKRIASGAVFKVDVGAIKKVWAVVESDKGIRVGARMVTRPGNEIEVEYGKSVGGGPGLKVVVLRE